MREMLFLIAVGRLFQAPTARGAVYAPLPVAAALPAARGSAYAVLPAAAARPFTDVNPLACALFASAIAAGATRAPHRLATRARVPVMEAAAEEATAEKATAEAAEGASAS